MFWGNWILNLNVEFSIVTIENIYTYVQPSLLKQQKEKHKLFQIFCKWQVLTVKFGLPRTQQLNQFNIKQEN